MIYALIAILVFFVSILIFMYFVGIFSKIKIKEEESGSFTIVYKSHIGDYKQIGLVIDNLYKELLKANIKTFKSIGIYYDNPAKVPMKQLRSEGGCIIEKQDYSKINSLEKEYNLKTIESAKSIVGEFPYKNKLSIMIGIIKFYPTLGKHIKEKGYKYGPVIEIYDRKNKKIIYIMNIIK